MAGLMSHLLCFGLGYSASVLARRLAAAGWSITATCRSPAAAAEIAQLGYRALALNGADRLPATALEGITHILSSAPPDAAGDPLLRKAATELTSRARQFAWVGYLSTTGVYGDHGGAAVSEATPATPNTERGKLRLAAERHWLELWHTHALKVHIFRLAGIYGPGRNPLQAILEGRARRIVKKGQVFSRIHVDDLASVLEASLARPNPGAVYNVCDDEAAPPQDVFAFAAELLGVPAPPAMPFEQAELTPMARSFYADSKRVSNQRIKRELGVKLEYPTYREGLSALASMLTR
jgi:nucleoside-diphosphate-sugar epimerase